MDLERREEPVLTVCVECADFYPAIDVDADLKSKRGTMLCSLLPNNFAPLVNMIDNKV
jgi:hypothetical protein